MGSEAVRQLAALSEVFRRTLNRHRPESVAVLGVAGGNGLEHIDPTVTKRVIGIDINQRYLSEVQRRFEALAGLELYCRDLGEGELGLPRVDLVHAALIFEHAGLDRALGNALSLLDPSGVLSVVLQLPSTSELGVAVTNYTSMQKVKQHFALIDSAELQRVLAKKDSDWTSRSSDHYPPVKRFGLVCLSRRGDGHRMPSSTCVIVFTHHQMHAEQNAVDPKAETAGVVDTQHSMNSSRLCSTARLKIEGGWGTRSINSLISGLLFKQTVLVLEVLTEMT
jgi:hypothetical protein